MADKKRQPTSAEWNEWIRYSQGGGKLDIYAWLEQGKPMPVPTGRGIMRYDPSGRLQPVAPGTQAWAEGPTLPSHLQWLPKAQAQPAVAPAKAAVAPPTLAPKPWEAAGITEEQYNQMQADAELDRRYKEAQIKQIEWGMRPEEITPWQKAQYQLSKDQEQRLWEAQQEERVANERNWRLQLQREDIASQQKAWGPIWERQALAAQFEAERAAKLEGITARGEPVDWITEWTTAHEPNPYKPHAGETQYTASWETGRPTPVSTIGNYMPVGSYNIADWEQYVWAEEASGGQDVSRPEMQARIKETARILMNQYQPSLVPPAPSWLPQYVPGQVTGQPITKEAVRTPGGQAWAATPYSQQQGLKGYTQWAGGRSYEDIKAHMAMMQPSIPYGVGGARWASPGQWS